MEKFKHNLSIATDLVRLAANHCFILILKNPEDSEYGLLSSLALNLHDILPHSGQNHMLSLLHNYHQKQQLLPTEKSLAKQKLWKQHHYNASSLIPTSSS